MADASKEDGSDDGESDSDLSSVCSDTSYSSTSDSQCKTLFVPYIAVNVTFSQVSSFFSECEGFKNVIVKKGKSGNRHAIVKFETWESAEKAHQQCSGQKIGGVKLKVKFARKRQSKSRLSELDTSSEVTLLALDKEKRNYSSKSNECESNDCSDIKSSFTCTDSEGKAESKRQKEKDPKNACKSKTRNSSVKVISGSKINKQNDKDYEQSSSANHPRIGCSEKIKGKKGAEKKNTEEFTVLITGFPSSVTGDNIEELLSGFEGIKRKETEIRNEVIVKLQVCFDSRKSAQECFEYLHKKEISPGVCLTANVSTFNQCETKETQGHNICSIQELKTRKEKSTMPVLYCVEIRNIDPNEVKTDFDFKQIVMKCSGVASTRLIVGKNENFGFADFFGKDHAHTAMALLDASQIGSKKLRTIWKGPSRNQCVDSPVVQMDDTSCIVVERLDPCVNREGVVALFHRCTGLIGVRLYPFKEGSRMNKAQIEFNSQENAVKAIVTVYGEQLNGTQVHPRLLSQEYEKEEMIAKTMIERLLDHIEDVTEQIKAIYNEKLKQLNEEMDIKPSKKRGFVSLNEFEFNMQRRKAILSRENEVRRFVNEFFVASNSIKSQLNELISKDKSSIFKCNEVVNLKRQFSREHCKVQNPLPMYAYRGEIVNTVKENQASVVLGETGSGKSTQMAQFIADAFRNQGLRGGIVCTQPRKVAAMTLAQRVAEEYGCKVGEEVGYHVGNSRKIGAKTLITFMTDRMLLNMCLQNRDLSQYAYIIVDEAHERSIDTDLLIGMLKDVMPRRPELKIVITSATINASLFSQYFNGCPVVNVPGRTYPVDVVWRGDKFAEEGHDYVKQAVDVALEIHHEEDEGDVLVFLTAANEIEKACIMMRKRLGIGEDDDGLSGVIILPLHGRLCPDDQMKVFQSCPTGVRKIVFATNVAETSVTIPGICFVIDSGMCKEKFFDPRKNMSCLEVKVITQSSAMQRAGRAGRTQPGKCYRLYGKNDFDDMEANSKPEILRVHLGMAVLKLIELGIQDIGRFDFVEAPEVGAIDSALASLRLLGAIDLDNNLLQLGRNMAAIELEPRLCKMVLEGIHHGYAKEIIIIAALMSVSGNVFYRGGTDENKTMADMHKVRFCHEGGDLLTMLDVYREWSRLDEKLQKKWCLENYVNGKSMRQARDAVKDINRALKDNKLLSHNRFTPPQQYAHTDQTMMNNKESDESERVTSKKDDGTSLRRIKESETLRKIIFLAYFQNTCMFNGHDKAGYRAILLNKSAQVHPSSALRVHGGNPNWMVYEEMFRTTRDFITNVTPIEPEWLQELPQQILNTIDFDDLQRFVLEESSIKPVGRNVLRRIIGKQGKRLREIQLAVVKSDNMTCIIEPNFIKTQVQVFAPPELKETAVRYVQKIVDDEKEALEKSQVENSLGFQESPIRCVLGAGAEVKCILMQHQYRSVQVRVKTLENQDGSIDTGKHLNQILTTANGVEDSFIFPQSSRARSHGLVGKITFRSPVDAESMVTTHSEDPVLRFQPAIKLESGRCSQLKPPTLELSWYQRLCKKFGFVEFQTEEDVLTAYGDVNRGFTLGGNRLFAKPNNRNPKEIFIRNLHAATTDEEIKQVIGAATAAKLVKVRSVRENAIFFDKVQVENKIQFIITALVPNIHFEVEVQEPKSDKMYKVYARVKFRHEDAGAAETVAASLQNNSQFLSPHQKILVKRELCCSVRVYARLYRLMKVAIVAEKGRLENENKDKLKIDVNEDGKNGSGDATLIIKGESVLETAMATVVFQNLIKGDDIEIDDQLSLIRILQSPSGNRFQTKLEAETNTFFSLDKRALELKIHGSKQDCKVAKTKLEMFIQEYKETMPRKIDLLPYFNESHLFLKNLLAQYGSNLEKLYQETGAQKLEINVLRKFLVVDGSNQSYQKVLDALSYLLSEKGKEDDGAEDCGICFCPIEDENNSYILEDCCHKFCKTCIDELVKDAIESKKFPMVCPYDECHKEILLCDLNVLCNPQKRNKITQSAVEAFVNQKSEGRYKYCPTPDCPMVYEVTTMGQVFTCPKCKNKICTSCHIAPHVGMSCAEFKRIKEGTPNDVLLWAKKGGKDVKICPTEGCGIIERTGGCDHVNCSKCKAHICWICLRKFKESGDCYGHLSSVHGGYGGGV